LPIVTRGNKSPKLREGDSKGETKKGICPYTGQGETGKRKKRKKDFKMRKDSLESNSPQKGAVKKSAVFGRKGGGGLCRGKAKSLRKESKQGRLGVISKKDGQKAAPLVQVVFEGGGGKKKKRSYRGKNGLE